MKKKNPVLFFLFKALLAFGLLSLPIKLLNVGYANFYCKLSNSLFGTFQGTGFAKFTIANPPSMVYIVVGNTAQKNADGTYKAATSRIKIRYRGYIPLILFLSLVLASRSSRKRKLFSSLVGFAILSGFAMFNQWIQLVYMCEQNEWLSLFDFTPGSQKRIEFLNENVANYNGTTMIVVIVTWFLTTFRKSDLEKLRG